MRPKGKLHNSLIKAIAVIILVLFPFSEISASSSLALLFSPEATQSTVRLRSVKNSTSDLAWLGERLALEFPGALLKRSESRLDIDNLIAELRLGNDAAAARLMSIIENGEQSALEVLNKIDEAAITKKPHRVGITGGVGVGKSTLVEEMVKRYREEGKRVAIVAIDPTSPVTGGAILADRMRLSMEQINDEDIFYRSMATRGGIGGIARYTDAVSKVFDLYGVDADKQTDVVIIETEGVGQSQKLIREITDTMVAVIPPKAGDILTLNKNSFLHESDVVVVNKSDLQAADQTSEIAKQIFEKETDKSTWSTKVIQTIAIEGVKESGKGIPELVDAIEAHGEFLEDTPREPLTKKRRFKKPKAKVLVIESIDTEKSLDFAKRLRDRGIEVLYHPHREDLNMEKIVAEEDIDHVVNIPRGHELDLQEVIQLATSKAKATRSVIPDEDGLPELINLLAEGDTELAARMISWIENLTAEQKKPLLRAIRNIPRNAPRIGFAGPPGVGKSSALGQLIKELRSAGLKVGVIAVDPSSQENGGAFLVDRYRMADVAEDKGVMIRSVGLRGAEGGVAKHVDEMARVMDAAGMDIVLIESEGSGQTQDEIKKVTDTTVLVLSPAYLGDIQTMKAGSMESLDITLLNQADTERAFVAMRELNAGLGTQPPLKDGWQRVAVQATSTEGRGFAELVLQLSNRLEHIVGQGSASDKTQAAAQALKKKSHSSPDLVRALRETHDADMILDQLGHAVEETVLKVKSFLETDPNLSSQIKAVDHAAVIVHDASAYRRPVYEVESENVKVAMIDNPVGEGRIEFVEPNDSSGTLADFLKKYGEDVHHIALEVESLDAFNEVALNAREETPGFENFKRVKESRNDTEGYNINFYFSKEQKLLIEIVEYDGGERQEHHERVLDKGDLPEVEKPGQYPFTPGIHEKPRGKVRYIGRQYAGEKTAKATNARFLALGSPNYSVAFQNASQIGLSSADPRAVYNIGAEGVSLDSIRDMEQVFDQIDILDPKVSVSMTINAAAAPMISIYISMAVKRLMARGMNYDDALEFAKKTLRVTVQNDNRKEYITRNNDGISENGADILTNEMFEFFGDWKSINTVSVSGYHMREAGSSDVQEVAFTLTNAILYAQSYFEYARERNIEIDPNILLKQFSFFFDSMLYDEVDQTKNNLARETAKFRAARRLWAKIAKHMLGATEPKAQSFRLHTQTSGVNLRSDPPGEPQVQQDLNVLRIGFEALAAVLGGTQSLHIDSKDEPVKLPGEFESQVAIQSHPVLSESLGISYDEFGTSETVQAFTDEIERDAFEIIQMLLALNKTDGHQAVLQYMREAIQNENMRKGMDKWKKYLDELDGEEPAPFSVPEPADDVQVNDETLAERMADYSALRDEVLRNLEELKSTRDNEKVSQTLGALRDAALANQNVMPLLIQAALAEATIGEMMGILKEVHGDTRRSVFPARTQSQESLKPIQSDRPVRALVAKPGLDGHDRGINQVSMFYKNAGVEVIYAGLRQTPEMVARAAVSEGVDFIGISSLSGARLHFVEDLMAELDKYGAREKIRVVIGGITEDEGPFLRHLGVDFIADPSQGTATPEHILEHVQQLADEVATVRSEARALPSVEIPFMHMLVIDHDKEGALAVVHAAKSLGIQTTVLYWDDQPNLEVRSLADGAIKIQKKPATRDDFLDENEVLEIVNQIGADVVHAGYGRYFPSAPFRKNLEGMEVHIVGPPGVTYETPLAEADAELFPDRIPVANVGEAREQASRLGYPVFLKSVAGLNRQINIELHSEEKLDTHFKWAQTSANTSFNNQNLYLEKAIENVRSAKIPFAADQNGHVVLFPTRVQSLQQGDNIYLEESASEETLPENAEIRTKVRDFLIEKARAGSPFNSLGTVEVIVKEDGDWHIVNISPESGEGNHFLESQIGMSGLQVNMALSAGRLLEDLDLYDSGATLTHSMNLKVFLNDPSSDTIPADVVRVKEWSLPTSVPGIQVISHIQPGQKILRRGSPLLAEIKITARNREEAIARLKQWLDVTEALIELDNGKPFQTTFWLYRQLVLMPSFKSGKYNTDYLNQLDETIMFKKGSKDTAPVYGEALENNHFVNPVSGQHHTLPVRQRIDMLMDPDSFVEMDADLEPHDHINFVGHMAYSEIIKRAQKRTGERSGIVTGVGTIGGKKVALGVVNFDFIAGTFGSEVGEKISRLTEHANHEGLPLILLTQSGGARILEGNTSMMQLGATSVGIAKYRREGGLYISLMADPSLAGPAVSYTTQGDVLLAEPGTRIGFAGKRVTTDFLQIKPEDEDYLLGADFQKAELWLRNGLIDGILHREQIRDDLARRVARFYDQGRDKALRQSWTPVSNPSTLAYKSEYDPSSPDRNAYDIVMRARGNGDGRKRPRALEYIEALGGTFEAWDNKKDPVVVGGVVRRDGKPDLVVVGTQKGGGLEDLRKEDFDNPRHFQWEQGRRNLGMPNHEGYRFSRTLFDYAEQHQLPVINYLDLPGGWSGPDAENQGVAKELGLNNLALANLTVPVITAIVGEGGSGGAKGLALANSIIIQENAYYSVIAPESAAAILFGKETSARKADEAKRLAEQLFLTPEALKSVHIVDEIIPEPGDGAYTDPPEAVRLVNERALAHIDALWRLTPENIRDHRFQRFRHLGAFKDGDKIVPPHVNTQTRSESRGDTDIAASNLAEGFVELEDTVKSIVWDQPEAGTIHIVGLPGSGQSALATLIKQRGIEGISSDEIAYINARDYLPKLGQDDARIETEDGMLVLMEKTETWQDHLYLNRFLSDMQNAADENRVIVLTGIEGFPLLKKTNLEADVEVFIAVSDAIRQSRVRIRDNRVVTYDGKSSLEDVISKYAPTYSPDLTIVNNFAYRSDDHIAAEIKKIKRSESRAVDARQIRSEIFQHINGLVALPTLYALSQRDVFQLFGSPQDSRPVSLEEFSQALMPETYENKMGNHYGALRTLAMQGWVQMSGVDQKTVFEITPLGWATVQFANQNAVRDTVRAIAHLKQYHEALRGPPNETSLTAIISEFELLTAASRRGWDLPEQDTIIGKRAVKQLKAQLDGIITSPVLIALGMPAFKADQVSISEDKDSIFEIFKQGGELDKHFANPLQLDFLKKIFEYLEYQDILKEVNVVPLAYELTERGEAFVNRVGSYGVTSAYLVSYEVLDQFLFSDAQPLDISLDKHIDRVMDIWGSSQSHAYYLEKTFIQQIEETFNRTPLDQQPAGIADMGAGDGTLLAKLVDYIINHTQRGQNLEEYPLIVIAADFNVDSTGRQLATLDQFSRVPGITTEVLFGDVTDPDRFDRNIGETLKQRNIVMTDSEGQTRQVGAQDLFHTNMFIPHERELKVNTIDEARHIIRKSIQKIDRETLSKLFKQPLPSDGEDLLNLVISQFQTSYSNEGELVPAAVVAADHIQFIERWAKYTHHGLSILELHTAHPDDLLEEVPDDESSLLKTERVPAAAYWGTHWFSQTIMPYAEYALTLVLAGLEPTNIQRFPNPQTGDLPTMVSFAHLKQQRTEAVAPKPQPIAPAKLTVPDSGKRRSEARYQDDSGYLTLTPQGAEPSLLPNLVLPVDREDLNQIRSLTQKILSIASEENLESIFSRFTPASETSVEGTLVHTYDRRYNDMGLTPLIAVHAKQQGLPAAMIAATLAEAEQIKAVNETVGPIVLEDGRSVDAIIIMPSPQAAATRLKRQLKADMTVYVTPEAASAVLAETFFDQVNIFSKPQLEEALSGSQRLLSYIQHYKKISTRIAQAA